MCPTVTAQHGIYSSLSIYSDTVAYFVVLFCLFFCVPVLIVCLNLILFCWFFLLFFFRCFLPSYMCFCSSLSFSCCSYRIPLKNKFSIKSPETTNCILALKVVLHSLSSAIAESPGNMTKIFAYTHFLSLTSNYTSASYHKL